MPIATGQRQRPQLDARRHIALAGDGGEGLGVAGRAPVEEDRDEQISNNVRLSALAMPNSGGAPWVAAWISVVNTSMRAGRPIRRGTS